MQLNQIDFIMSGGLESFGFFYNNLWVFFVSAWGYGVVVVLAVVVVGSTYCCGVIILIKMFTDILIEILWRSVSVGSGACSSKKKTFKARHAWQHGTCACRGQQSVPRQNKHQIWYLY